MHPSYFRVGNHSSINDLELIIRIARASPQNGKGIVQKIRWQEKLPCPDDREKFDSTHLEEAKEEAREEDIRIFTFVNSDKFDPTTVDQLNSLKNGQVGEDSTNSSSSLCTSKQKLSKSIKNRYERDEVSEVMYILASITIDQDMPLESNQNTAEKPIRHTEILCSLKFKSGGILEMTPGLSTSENGTKIKYRSMFKSNIELNKLIDAPIENLTTFGFYTADGSKYHYTIENPTAVNIEMMEEKTAILERKEIQDCLAKDKHKALLGASEVMLSENLTYENEIVAHICIEIKSLTCYCDLEEPLTCYYEVMLPSCWKLADVAIEKNSPLNGQTQFSFSTTCLQSSFFFPSERSFKMETTIRLFTIIFVVEAVNKLPISILFYIFKCNAHPHLSLLQM